MRHSDANSNSDTHCYCHSDCYSYPHCNGNTYSPTHANAKIGAFSEAAPDSTPSALITQMIPKLRRKIVTYSESGSSRIRFTADLASHSRAFCRNSAAVCNASFSFMRI